MWADDNFLVGAQSTKRRWNDGVDLITNKKGGAA